MHRSQNLATAVAAIAALAFAALPALASAAEPTVDFSAANPTSSGTFGSATLTSANGNIVCAGENHFSGTAITNASNEGTTANTVITFTNCTGPLGATCTTTGQASGVIKTETSVAHLIYIKGFTKTVGDLTTPAANGLFAKFSCGIFGNVEIKGTGLIGHVSAPACGETSSSATLNFESSAAHVQKYQEIEGSTTKFHMTSNLNGGAFTEASMDVTNATGTLAGGATGKLTCP